jgi:hypothetical protein
MTRQKYGGILNDEIERLRVENARLKMQLDDVTAERDELQAQLDTIRRAAGVCLTAAGYEWSGETHGSESV